MANGLGGRLSLLVERVELPHFKAKDATVVYGMSAAADLDDDGDLDLVLAAGVPVELGVIRPAEIDIIGAWICGGAKNDCWSACRSCDRPREQSLRP
jgi:hypothetical protein